MKFLFAISISLSLPPSQLALFLNHSLSLSLSPPPLSLLVSFSLSLCVVWRYKAKYCCIPIKVYLLHYLLSNWSINKINYTLNLSINLHASHISQTLDRKPSFFVFQITMFMPFNLNYNCDGPENVKGTDVLWSEVKS